MNITFINVGYGEAILLEVKQQDSKAQPYTVMIDGGGSEALEFDSYVHRIRASDYLKRNGIKKIDLLINTHIHEDHTCGLLDIIKQTQIEEFWCSYEIPSEFGNVFISTPDDASESMTKFISAVNCYNKIYFDLKNRGIPIRHIYGVQQGIPLECGLCVDILGPSYKDYVLLKDKMNEMYSLTNSARRNDAIKELDVWMNMVSIMLRFDYHGIKMFLPADVNYKGYGHLADSMDLLRADIYKTAHHGQEDGVTCELAMHIRPRVVVTCASSDRRYNSSNPKTFETIEKCAMDFGGKPIFLFSDNVRVKSYSENIIPHSAVIVEINDKTSQICCRYI